MGEDLVSAKIVFSTDNRSRFVSVAKQLIVNIRPSWWRTEKK